MTQTELPPVVEDTTAPFPLTDIQAAYVVGRSELIELGGRQQYYIEFDSVGFDAARAEAAMNQLIGRHEQLRTVMSEDGTQRVMEPDATPSVHIAAVDLRGQTPERQEEALATIRTRMFDDGIDPTGWPLFQVVASRIRNHRTRVHVRISLLLLDAPSMRTVISEWERLYVDPAAELPPIRQTFRQWRIRLAKYEDGPHFAKQWQYWQQRLDDLPEAPSLPLARRPKRISAVRFEGRTVSLTREQWQRLRTTFRKHRVLPTTAMIHVLAEVLGTWAASPRFCLNVVHLNHMVRHPGEDVIGQRTATLPLAVDLSCAESFWERARILQRRLWHDMENSDVTGVRISRELAARHGWTDRAAFPYVFTSNQGSGWDTLPAEGGPLFRFLGRIQHTPQVLFDNQLRDLPGGGIASNLDFVDEAFPPGLPDAVADAYRRLLLDLSEEGSGEREPVLVPPEHRTVVDAVNFTSAPHPAGRLEDGFREQVRRTPDAPALYACGRTLSYREVDDRSAAVAAWLRRQGVQPGDVVPIVMVKGWEQVVAAIGVLRAGAAYCPIDAGYPAERVQALIEECAAPAVLTQDTVASAPVVDEARVDSVTDLAYVIYTSGSTGRPKGVMIEHRAAANTVHDINSRIGLGPSDRVLGISSLSFDLSVWDVFGTLAAGAALTLPAGGQPDPQEWAEAAARTGVTVWNSVPALAEMLVEYLEQRPEQLRPPIRAFLLSGDWIPTGLPTRLRAFWPGCRIVAMGGATEAAIWSNAFEVTEVDPEWESIPYGRPLTNQTMRVLDHRMEIRPPWVVGEIYIGGSGLARGYRNAEELTAERFLRHPVSGERLYRTGDLGRYRPDGVIEFLGRSDRQVKIQGFRVELGEVEAAIRRDPAVLECVTWVEGEPGRPRRLRAAVVGRDGIDGRAVLDGLRTRLPHHLVPAQVTVVPRLPLTANGKVDVRRLTALTAPATAGPGAVEGSPLLTRLAAIWADLLELPRIDPDDNFFELGGNSLLALRMVNRVRAQLGTDVPMGQLFESPELREFARRVADGGHRDGHLVRMSDGHGPQLFLFHVIGGSITRYLPLAHAWPGRVMAFQSGPADSAGERDEADLGAMAATYVEELLRHQPTGPYVLGGWSMGGNLAYEAARRLGELGHRAYVFIIDSELRDLTLPATEIDRHVGLFTALALAPPPAEAVAAVHAAPAGEVARVARSVAVEHGWLPDDVGLPHYLVLLRTMEYELSALARYRPAPSPQPTLYFLAARETGRPDPVPVWRDLAGDLTVHEMPADHYTISDERIFADIARHVLAWLPPELTVVR
jgi:amino acid adenylation domain-containing protein